MGVANFLTKTGQRAVVSQAEFDREVADCTSTDWQGWTGEQRAFWAAQMVGLAADHGLTAPARLARWARLSPAPDTAPRW